MDYYIEDSRYHFSYQELKEKHLELCALKNDQFLKQLPQALHIACFICWLKELGNEATISDKGIIHELVHLLHIPEEPLVDIKKIRKQFKQLLLLN